MPKGRNKDSRRRKRLNRELERERGVVYESDWHWDKPRRQKEEWEDDDYDWEEDEDDLAWDDPDSWYVDSVHSEDRTTLN